MNEILKVEKAETFRSLFAAFIDALFVIALGVVFFFGAYQPLFKATTSLGTAPDYIVSVRKVESTDDKHGYNLDLEEGLTYDKYVLEAKYFFEYHAEKITTHYYETALKDNSVPEEYKERFKDLELIYNYIFLGLDYRALATEETSYSNNYFIYKFDNENNRFVWEEYAIDNPRTEELNERGIAEREDYVYYSYNNLDNILHRIDPDYVTANQDINLFTNICTFLSSFTSILILYILIPACFKTHQTLGKKIFGYGYINTKNGKTISYYKILLKTLMGMVLPLIGMYFCTIYTVIMLVVFPYFINLIYYLLKAKDYDILDKILRMKLINVKDSLMFENDAAEIDYLKNEDLSEYDDAEKDYTDMLSRLSTLDFKSIEEKIEDEQRSNEKSK